jgi:hypothetical protein
MSKAEQGGDRAGVWVARRVNERVRYYSSMDVHNANRKRSYSEIRLKRAW